MTNAEIRDITSAVEELLYRHVKDQTEFEIEYIDDSQSSGNNSYEEEVESKISNGEQLEMLKQHGDEDKLESDCQI